MSDDLFSIIDSLDLANVPDQEPVESGEYELQVLSCEVADSKSGGKNLVVVFKILNAPNALNVFRYYSLPTPQDDAEKQLRKRRFIKEFAQALSLEPSMLAEQAKGATCFAILTEEEYEGQVRNVIKKFIMPR